MTETEIQAFPSKPRALIVGVNGQDGSYLAKQMVLENWEVYGCGRQDNARPEVADSLSRYEKVDLLELEQYQKALSNFSPDVIFYTAAVHGPDGFEYEKHWRETHIINTLGVNSTLEYIRLEKPSSKIIYFSSAKAFGPLAGCKIDESSRRYSDCLYSLTKNSSADLIEYYRQNFGIDASVIWLFNHESSRRTSKHFVSKVLSCLMESKSQLTLSANFKTLDFWCDWGSAEEFMTLLAQNCMKLSSEDYVLATGRTVWARDIVKELFTRHGLKVEEHIVTASSSKKEDTPHWVADIGKFKQVTGMEPSISGIDVFENIYHDLVKQNS